MRYLKILLLLVAGIGLLRAQDPAAKRESVLFDGQVLLLASQNESPQERVKEYIPEAEKLESWTKLASIREYPQLNDPKAVGTNLLRMVKQQNSQAPGALVQDAKTGDVIVDFITWPPNGAFYEFNVFKYSKKKGGGLIAHQYALRAYRDTSTFLRGMKERRLHLVDLMKNNGLEMSAEKIAAWTTAALQGQLEKAKEELAELRKTYSDNTPAVRSKLRKVTELETRLGKATEEQKAVGP